jgi:hypothetical protein
MIQMLRPSVRRCFYVAVCRKGSDRDCWSWEIRRKHQPMGVRIWEVGFRSYAAAELAGRKALEDFLNGLSIEATSGSP